MLDGKLNMSLQCVPRKSPLSWDASKNVTSRSEEVILPIYSVPVKPHLECCVQYWCSQGKKDVELLKLVQRSAMKLIRGPCL